MIKNLAKKSILSRLTAMDKGSMNLQLPDQQHLQLGSSADWQADMQVHSDMLWKRVALYGDIGFAESYMAGEWDTTDLTALLKWFLLNIDKTPGVSGGGKTPIVMNVLQTLNRLSHVNKANSKSGSKKNIKDHYDLSNDFFSLILDETMTYSSGIFEDTSADLKEAQLRKYQSLCELSGMREGDHVLEIGTGWGGFAEYAASKYQLQVTTVTISEEQYAYATDRIRRAGLDGKVHILLQDYRDIQGQFDKVVSIEMIEAVGASYLNAYFSKIHEVLKPDGVLALQAIVCPDNRFELLKNRVDFIQKHIFPGSLLPSIAAINKSVNETGDMFLFMAKDLGKSYAKTLKIWRTNFQNHLSEIKEMGFDDVFIRKWFYYFSYCEAAFYMRNINVLQLIYTRPNNHSFGNSNH